jgi:hypothetical protein
MYQTTTFYPISLRAAKSLCFAIPGPFPRRSPLSPIPPDMYRNNFLSQVKAGNAAGLEQRTLCLDPEMGPSQLGLVEHRETNPCHPKNKRETLYHPTNQGEARGRGAGVSWASPGIPQHGEAEMRGVEHRPTPWG